MDMRIVNSSNIKAVGYDPINHSMRVQFNTGNLYEYREVPEDIFRQLLISPSIGKFFASQVKNRFLYTIVNDSDVDLDL